MFCHGVRASCRKAAEEWAVLGPARFSVCKPGRGADLADRISSVLRRNPSAADKRCPRRAVPGRSNPTKMTLKPEGLTLSLSSGGNTAMTDWPRGKGEMSRRIRTHDWAATPLGPIESWAPSLRTAVGLMLASGHAMQLAWGPQRIVLYNDAYAPMLGERHPRALGIPFREAWPEIWDEIEPLVEQVFAGETVRFEDMPLVMTRHGFEEDTWWNFSYSPVEGEAGEVAGLLNVTVDASAKHRAAQAERERDQANAWLQDNERRFRALVTAGGNSVYRMSPDWKTMYQLDGQSLASTAAPIEDWVAQYIPDEDLPAVRSAIDQAIRTKSLFELEHRVRQADGSVGWVLSRAVPLLGEDGEISEWFGAATDTTARRETISRLRDSEERNTFLLKLSDALRPLDGADAIQETASRLLAQHLGVSRALYSEVEGDGDARLVFVRGQYVADGPPFPSPVRYEDFANADVVQTFRTGGTLVVADTEQEAMLQPVTRSAWTSAGVAALVAVSLVKHGLETAHFSVHSAVPRAWKPSEVQLVREVAERTWSANERARVEAALLKSTAMVHAALAEAERAQAALRRDDEAKDRFLAVLSHELRNPLASISAASQLLARARLEEASRTKATSIIGRQTHAMKTLLDDLLDISRLRLGKLTLKREEVSIESIVESAVEGARTLMESHRHTLTVSVQKGPMTVDGDPVRLVQAVSNLVTNAAKYTPPGGRVALKAHAMGDSVVIEVLDNGVGIEPSRVESMFEMFAQGHQGSGDAGQYGLGIGLALVRSIVELHGGEIHGESAGIGFGSRFVVTLPLVQGAHAGDAHAGSIAATVSAPQEEPYVLLVDDNTDAIWSVAALLERCATETAATGSQGLRLARQRMPDVAVLDLGLPDMSGLELGRALRALPGGEKLLLVAVTGWGQERDREQTMKAGFDAHLVKPIEIDDLQGLIDQHLRKPS